MWTWGRSWEVTVREETQNRTVWRQLIGNIDPMLKWENMWRKKKEKLARKSLCPCREANIYLWKKAAAKGTNHHWWRTTYYTDTALTYITTTTTCQPTDLWPRCWFARRPAVVVRTLLSRQPVSRVSESALDVHEDGVESHQVRLEGEVAGVVLRRTVAVLVLRVAPLVALLVRELTETCTVVGLLNINVNELIHIKTSMRTSTISIRDHLFKLQTTQFKLDVAKNSIYLVATGTNILILLLPLTPLFTSRMHFALYISKRYWRSTYT